MRGLAILLVLAVHFFGQAIAINPTTAIGRAAYAATLYGWSGVDLFFVLSGFLVTSLLLRDRHKERYLRNFYARRVLRIFPLYYALLVGVIAVLPHVTTHGSANMQFVADHQAWYWAFVPNVLFYALGRYDVPLFALWSLAVEEQFYLVWPSVLKWVQTPRNIGRVCIGGIVMSLVVRTVLWATGQPPVGGYVLLPARADALMAGALAAVAWCQRGAVSASARTTARAAALVALGLIVWFQAGAGGHPAVTVAARLFGFSANVVVSAALLVSALSADEASWTARVWTSAPLRFFGRYSYGMYLLHPFLLTPSLTLWHRVAPLRERIGAPLSVVLFAAGFLLLTSSMALVSWHLLEQPMLRLKRHFEPRGAKPAASVATRGAAPGTVGDAALTPPLISGAAS